ncbi:hypothetical protein BB559_007553 [Furculomyces boomerangus]|uniref:Uncharacterized protein n=2 Tax=Harpellales TaxID=61421 RepID=A0A2T9XWX1_9FUNG|nr:hypothetical protein BB559_007553 [Furculomyces boomerangus]PVZ98527.1 hypothetical protein BB558_005466 [Smittium angustum]
MNNNNQVYMLRQKGWYWTVEPARFIYKCFQNSIFVRCPKSNCRAWNSFHKDSNGLGANAYACFRCNRCKIKIRATDFYYRVLRGFAGALPEPTEYALVEIPWVNLPPRPDTPPLPPLSSTPSSPNFAALSIHPTEYNDSIYSNPMESPPSPSVLSRASSSLPLVRYPSFSSNDALHMIEYYEQILETSPATSVFVPDTPEKNDTASATTGFVTQPSMDSGFDKESWTPKRPNTEDIVFNLDRYLNENILFFAPESPSNSKKSKFD